MSDSTSSVGPEPAQGGRGAHGAAVTMAFQVVKLIVQVLSIVSLARLVPAHEFGVYAMVMPIYVFSLLFQDSGLAQAIVQRDKLSPVELNNIFALNLAICSLVVALLASAAPLIAAFYREAGVRELVWAFCGVTLLNCLTAQPMAMLTRAFRFGYLAALDLGSYTLGFLVSLALAMFYPTYWALFAMPAITAVITLFGAWLGASWRPGLPSFSASMLDLTRFGSGVFGFNFLNYFTRNTDIILLGRFATAADVGAYDRANRLILFPIQQINIPLGRVFLPILSRIANDAQAYRKMYLDGVGGILLATQAGILWLICDGETVIPLLLGEAWRSTAEIFVWMGVAALWQPLTYTAGWLFISQDRTNTFWKWGLFNAVVSVLGFVAAIPWGVTGFAVVYAARENLIRLPALLWLTGREGPVTTPHLLRGLLPFPFACAAVAGSILVRQALLPMTGLAAVVGDLVLAYIVYGLTLLLFPRGRSLFGSALAAARALRRRKP